MLLTILAAYRQVPQPLKPDLSSILRSALERKPASIELETDWIKKEGKFAQDDEDFLNEGFEASEFVDTEIEDQKPLILNGQPFDLDLTMNPVVQMKKLKSEEIEAHTKLHQTSIKQNSELEESVSKGEPMESIEVVEIGSPSTEETHEGLGTMTQTPEQLPNTQLVEPKVRIGGKETIFRFIRPVDMLGMVGKISLLAQSGVQETLELIPGVITNSFKKYNKCPLFI